MKNEIAMEVNTAPKTKLSRKEKKRSRSLDGSTLALTTSSLPTTGSATAGAPYSNVVYESPYPKGR